MTPPCVPSATSVPRPARLLGRVGTRKPAQVQAIPEPDQTHSPTATPRGVWQRTRPEAGLVVRRGRLSPGGGACRPGEPPAGSARFPASVSAEPLLADALTGYLPRTSLAGKGSLRLRAPRALAIVWPRLGQTRCRGESPVALCDAAAGFSNSDYGSGGLHRPGRASGPGPDRPLPAPGPHSWRAFEEYAECENAKLLKAFGSLPKDRGRYQGSLRMFVTSPASSSGNKVMYQTEMYGKLKEDMLRKRTQKMIK
ncbi:uncharacterized protein LOC116878161 [Lontra canadensis]|uniref:uncharacterized protein LOC116878161 n=1 Tax=Lontra canadensis TaxID=76717 RepID=UPI0013F2CF7E|nr:uncharacterized protein LOC116878161 [Lontra canadensis]